MSSLGPGSLAALTRPEGEDPQHQALPLRCQAPGAAGSLPSARPDPADGPVPRRPQYLLDSNSWIEEMPSERLCRSTRQRAACAQLRGFLQEYGTQGCQV